MADTTSAGASAVPSPQGQSAPPTSPAAPPQAATPKATTPAPAPAGQPDKSDPEERIKRLQSTLSQKDRQAQQEKAALQQQLAAMQAQMTQLATQNMGEDEAQAFRTQQYVSNLEAQLAQHNAAAQMAQAQLQINSALYRIASTTNIPFATLQERYEEVRDADEVWSWAYEQSVSKLTAKERAAGERDAAKLAAAQEAAEEAALIEQEPVVDLGSGRALREEDPRSAALKRNDAKAAVLAHMNARKKP
jgi:hypothetical protein